MNSHPLQPLTLARNGRFLLRGQTDDARSVLLRALAIEPNLSKGACSIGAVALARPRLSKLVVPVAPNPAAIAISGNWC